MHQPESQSVVNYIRKRSAKKLPTQLSLQLITEIGLGLIESSKQDSGEIVKCHNKRLSGFHSSRDIADIDIIDQLVMGYPALQAITVAARETNEPNGAEKCQQSTSEKQDVYALGRIACELLTGIRPAMDNEPLESRYDAIVIGQNRVKRWQLQALSKALASDPTQRPSIEKFLAELNTPSVIPLLQRTSVLLIVVMLGLAGMYGLSSVDSEKIQGADRYLKDSESGKEGVDFALFEVQELSDYIATNTDLHRFDKSRPVEEQWLEPLVSMDEVAAAYFKLLSVDPKNSAAQRGLQEIGDKYLQLIHKVLETGDKQFANELLERGLNSVPKHKRLLSLRNKIQNPATKKALDNSVVKAIARLVKDADEHIKASRFILPLRNNAVETYKEILRLDSHNSVAVDGLNSMATVFENAAQESLAAGNLEESLALIEQGLMIRPKHTHLLTLQTALAAELAESSMR